MRKHLCCLIVSLLSYLFCSQIVSAPLTLPQNLIAYNSLNGKTLLLRSINQEYLQLSTQFLTQKTQAYCGIASITMALNALGITGPLDPVYAPFHPITQDNFFTPAVKKIITPNYVLLHGLTLDQATKVANAFPVNAYNIHSERLTLKTMRSTLLTALKSNRTYIIINYFRPTTQQIGGGHFSPIAAYDTHTDRFLILDVARYKYPPVWIKTADLWAAINTIDTDSHKKRGLLLIRK